MKQLSRSVRGLTVLVTGAGSGMGRATAEVFAAEGAHVAVTDYNLESAQETAKLVVAANGSAEVWRLDVSEKAEIDRVVGAVAAHFGGIDIVVNNAGIANFLKIDDPDYDAVWDRTVAVNLTAHQRVIRAALPHLRRSGSPRIINIASVEGMGATAQLSPYSSMKAGVIGLTRSLAVELGPEGITVNCVCPGPILTGMTADIEDNDKVVFAKRRTALRRYGYPEEVAHVTLSLALPASSYVTGIAIPVDGGHMARNA